jgi:mono/diheme cytochrome c family protein
MFKRFFCAGAIAAFFAAGCVENRVAAGDAETKAAVPGAGAATSGMVTNGRALFLKNCAHCHGADAHGDDGPDLHGLGLTDDQIGGRIRKGKKGQMTAFAGKLQPAEIDALVVYVQTLK